MKKLSKSKRWLLVFAMCSILLISCSPANVDDVKTHAEATFNQLGFKIIGYEGYNWGLHVFPNYGGAHVWYTLKRIPDNGIIYTGSLQRWGNEYHNTYMRAIDAIKP